MGDCHLVLSFLKNNHTVNTDFPSTCVSDYSFNKILCQNYLRGAYFPTRIMKLTGNNLRMRKYVLLFLLIHGFNPGLYAQMVSGTVKVKSYDQMMPLPGVSVYWSGSKIATVTDAGGKFSLYKPESYSRLVFSFVGYTSDTISVNRPADTLNITLIPQKELKEVEIVQRRSGSHLDRLSPILTEKITYAELCKAACCNLAESFTTNASVDAYYSNAVTGARQIRLLGLDGAYVQILTENIPNMRGLAGSYGLSYFPGPWMEGIMISKGTASVRNGYESISGQINVEYLKPTTADLLSLNLFASNAGRKEVNLTSAVKITDRISTAILAHYSDDQHKEDHNGDDFQDEPLYRQYNVLNRWYFSGEKVKMHAVLRILSEDRSSGQMGFKKGQPLVKELPYGIGINTRRIEGFVKIGYVFNNNLNSSLGSINSFSNHDQKSFFGLRNYNGKQFNYYLNLMYQTDVINSNHKLVSGLSFNLDNYQELLDGFPISRNEQVPGFYSEYSFKPSEHFDLMAGLRLDYHNIYGLMLTPRIHSRFDINGVTHFRFSFGKGYRSPMILAENNYFLASSRKIVLAPNLKQEEAWNMGLSITRYITLGVKPLAFSMEVYRTSFLEQIIVDLDSGVHEVRFSNLSGKSFSNNYQLEMTSQFLKGLETKVAFRLTDVKYTIGNALVEKPLVSRYKGLFVASYQTPLKKWQFDLTWQLNGPGRIPSTLGNLPDNQMPDTFKAYFMVNAQITKYFRTWDLYVGVENLLSFVQTYAIIDGENPFGDQFDSSLIWGPLHGRKIYLGIRYRIERNDETDK